MAKIVLTVGHVKRKSNRSAVRPQDMTDKMVGVESDDGSNVPGTFALMQNIFIHFYTFHFLITHFHSINFD